MVLESLNESTINIPDKTLGDSSTDTAFDRMTIRQALKLWRSPRELGQHPLADLNIAISHEHDEESSIGRGVALREVLKEAIEALRPHHGEPDYMDRTWHPYLILVKQYIEKRSPTHLAGQMCIARREYYRRQTHALDLLGGILFKMEQHCACGEPFSAEFTVPFMAPLRSPHALVGRTRLLNHIKRRLFTGTPGVLCAFSGLPGVGKTTLAIELANDAQVLAHFADGILWAGLGRRPDVFALLGTWGMALGISENELARLTAAEERARVVHTAIGLRRMLLVIDDTWQLETALAFKLGGPNCAHVLTTRIPETAQAFAGDGAFEVPELAANDSLTLLKHIAPLAVETRPDEVQQLAQVTGGLPLALSLMGWHLRKASLGASQQRLQRALQQLTRTQERLNIAQTQPLLEYHPDLPSGTPLSLQAVIGISDDALNPVAQQAVRALSVFVPKPNSFSEEAALAVAGVPAEALDTLIDHGLLTGTDLGRYALHQSIADYMRVRLAETPVVQRAVHERLADYFGRYIKEHQENYVALESELQNIQTALDLAFDERMAPALIQMVNDLHDFLRTRGLYTLTIKHVSHATQMARQQGDKQNLAMLLRYQGLAVFRLGDYIQAKELYQEGLRLARDNQDLYCVCELLKGLASVSSKSGDLAQAKNMFLQGLSIAREIQNPHIESSFLNDLSVLHQEMGKIDLAIDYAQQALEIAVKSGERKIECSATNNLGISYGYLGQIEKNIEYNQQALAIAREVGIRFSECIALESLGHAYHDSGQLEQALAYYQQALTVQHEIGYRRGKSIILGNIGVIHKDLKQMKRAIEYIEQALNVARAIGEPRSEEEWLGQLGHTYYASGQVENAGEYYQQALLIARQIGHRKSTEEWLGGLAQVHLDQGQVEQAIECYEQALESARQAGDHESESTWQRALDDIRLKYESLPIEGPTKV